MPQTIKNNQPTNSSLRAMKPGQRQQERLMRVQRRRRRQRNILISIVTVLLVIVAGLSFWQYQRYSSDQVNAGNEHATATAVASKKHFDATVQAMVGTPTAPADKPPTIDQTPKSLPDGLQYIDLQEGIGPAIKSGDTANVMYTGWVKESGAKFDSTYDQQGRQPFSVQVGQGSVIKGWDEGLVGMKAGGKRRLIIPPALGYADQAQGPIPPNSTLIFDIAVTSVKAGS